MLTPIRDYWNRRNDEGEGYAIGDEDQTPSEAIERDGYKVIGATSGGIVAGYDGQSVVLVGYAHGPWAVDAPSLVFDVARGTWCVDEN